jgi:hypothetical protein
MTGFGCTPHSYRMLPIGLTPQQIMSGEWKIDQLNGSLVLARHRFAI